MSWIERFEINTISGTKQIEVENGVVQFIAGPNGVGKSALLHEIFKKPPAEKSIELLPGHRQITFPNDDIDQIGQTIEQLQLNMRASVDAFSRFRGAWGDAHLKSFIKRALAKEADTNFKIAELVRNKECTDTFIVDNPSIVRSINGVFDAARLKIQVDIQDARFVAKRGGASFKIDVLSDGERAALLLVCAILSQQKDGILLIDEPEKHLNAAISGPLIASAVQSRLDIGFVISSHDLELIKWVKPKQIIHVRNSQTSPAPYHGSPEIRTYDLEFIDSADGVSEDIKQAILGAKEKILFVEGTSSSDDRLLYSLVYKDRSVVARGGWDAVVNNVRVLRQNSAYAWLSVAGMIDNDGRNPEERAALLADGIYCVNAPTIENLFMHPEVIAAISDEAHKFFGGNSGAQRMQEVIKILPSLLMEHKLDIVHRKCVWIVNRLVSEKKISVKSLSSGLISIDGINVDEILKQQCEDFDRLLKEADPLTVISQVPIKTTKIPGRVSKVIGFDSFDKLKQSILKQMSAGGAVADTLLSAVKSRLPVVSS